MNATKTAVATGARRNGRTAHAGQVVNGNVTRETLEMGHYVPVGDAQEYRSEAQCDAVLADATAWAHGNGERRVVNHYSEQGRARHVQVYPTPCAPDGEWEFETWTGYNRQGVDYTPPSVQ